MITALVSAITGLISGIVPDVLREIRDTRAAQRELQFLKLNHELAMARASAEANVKLEEDRSAVISEEIRAVRDQVVSIVENQFKPTGVKWIDALNSFIRPATCIAFMIMFIVGVAGYSFGIIENNAFGSTMTALFGESVMATLGFLFGYRSSQKLPISDRSWQPV